MRGDEMADLAFVMQRVDEGDKVQIFQDFYGRQWLELSRGWLLKRKTRVQLKADEMMKVRAVLDSRRGPR
jgi:hypothetical protein